MLRNNKIIVASLTIILAIIFIFILVKKIFPAKNEWVEDINYLQDTLIRSDKKLYYSEDTINIFVEQLNELKNNLKYLDNDKIQIKLSQIVAEIGESHTNFGELNNSTYIYPLRANWFDEGLFIMQADKKYEQIIGTQLIMINNIKIADVLKKIDTLIPHENEQWLKNQEPSFFINPSVLKYFNITNGQDAVFTFKDISNKTLNIKISPENIKSINYISINRNIKNTPLYLKGNDYYWYNYFPETKLLYFQYNICMDKDDLKKMYPNDTSIDELPTFKDMSNEMYKLFMDKKVSEFVMDLRFNTGGNSSYGSNFINNLKSIIPKGENIKCFVIVGKETYSSGITHALEMKDILNAKIVGQNTGGSPNSFGNVINDKLPHSGITFSYCTDEFTHVGYTNTVVPDIRISNSIYDYLKGEDRCMDKILNK